MMTFSNHEIGAFLCRHTFHRKHLVIVPNCNWPGNETDYLVVTTDRRIIDDCLDIARLAALRMWDSYDELRRRSA